MAAYTYRIQGQYETCSKRLQDDQVVCAIDVIKQDTVTGEIHLVPAEIAVPVALSLPDAIAAFEAAKQEFNFEGY